MIAESIEISRRPEDVFAYAADYSHFPQWQRRVVSARQEVNAPLAVGSRAAVIRRVGPRQLLTTEEITELDPPRTWQVRGTGRLPVVAIATGTVKPPLTRASGRSSRSPWNSTATGSAGCSSRSSAISRANSCRKTGNS